MQLSVIILNYNVQSFLQLCLDSVFRSLKGINAEVIVVDNNSSDDSCQMVKTNFPATILIENKNNVGFAKANNQAVSVAKGEYICILNPDTVVPETIFVNTLQKAQLLPNLGILGVQLIDGRGQFLPESKRNLPTPLVSICKISGQRFQYLAPYYANHINANSEGNVAVFVGAFMLLKRKVFLEAKGFDERYFMYGEDIDLSYSIEKLGYRNYYYGSEKIIHFKGESTLKNAVYRKRFYGAMKLFYQKHFASSLLVNTTIYVGIKLAALLKKSEVKQLGVKFNYAKVLSSNHHLIQTIQRKTNVFTKLTTVNEVYGNIKLKAQTLCYLDMSQLSYNQAILLIASNSSSKYGFRFVFSNGKIALGSDTSTGRGQVISL